MERLGHSELTHAGTRRRIAKLVARREHSNALLLAYNTHAANKIHHDFLDKYPAASYSQERNPTEPAACHMLDLHPKGLDQHSASGSQLLSTIEVLYLKPRNGFPHFPSLCTYFLKNHTASGCIAHAPQWEAIHHPQRCAKITF